MDRRTFLMQGSAALLATQVTGKVAPVTVPTYRTSNARWQGAYDAALKVLEGNVQTMPRYDKPVLIEGSVYRGIWMECGPLEALVYRKFRPDIARNSHTAFFALQKPDGQFPSANKVAGIGFGQIQMVVPIAATAWELARATRDEALLQETYKACAAWDAWLVRNRNTRGTGLTEGFCTYDSGHDNSPRWAGVPNACPGGDAKNIPPGVGVPRLCPDLSATTYSARLALAGMALALGKTAEADRWTESAERMRGLILAKLYDEDDAAFYDLDVSGQFVKVRGDVLTRVCGEHVVDQKLFDVLWTRQLHNPAAFWSAYPLPSIALDDPKFVRPIPRNSWGGAAQALTALRAPRWFDHYGRAAEFGTMMDRWCEAIQRDMSFRQQMDPLSGEFTQADAPGYSPCALVMMDFTWRLAGIVEQPETLEWNIRPGHAAAQGTQFSLPTDIGKQAELAYSVNGAELRLAGKPLGRIEGGALRLISSKDGKLQAILGLEEKPQAVTLHLAGRQAKKIILAANERIAL